MGGKSVQDLKDIANKLRISSIKATNASNSGHPTSCCSMAEIMSVLFFNTMKFKVVEPRDPSSDRFVLSKGHAAPILYAAWAEAGLFPEEDLLKLRKVDCDLEGHPTPRLSFIDVATGSLGQGLSVSCGMAYTGKYLENAGYRVYCLIGDGESAEGSIWEALSFAGHYKLDNLVAIFDINRLGQSEPTMFQHQMDVYEHRLKAFGLVFKWTFLLNASFTGEDGPSQMGLEDIAMFRTIPGCTVFYPSDAVSTERACELAANKQGICFIRTSRPNTPVIYANDEPFAIGKAKVVKKSANDVALVIGAGVTLFEALKAADILAQQGINIRVIDIFTVKPIDIGTIQSNAKECGGRIITVEDHYSEGGIGEAVAGAVSCCRNTILTRLAVTGIPRSGPPAVLMDMFGISANHIIKAVEEIKDL
ncbi:transketolase-like protein 2 [Trichonephila inaurata madagascariensis]|uniref:Transketolase n=1 Tax=Trichonephila inaurata madagascariensis TaxID=2747483 RepID=A0A8X6Y0V2_9ARAC|nr:transketolase-like protein 2 [Trichonephila inaurata madagascariensis]